MGDGFENGMREGEEGEGEGEGGGRRRRRGEVKGYEKKRRRRGSIVRITIESICI